MEKLLQDRRGDVDGQFAARRDRVGQSHIVNKAPDVPAAGPL